MQIAIISDIHGNEEALNSVLDDIENFKPDQIICAGDMLNPLASSRLTYLRLKKLEIPMIRGNHEDYIIKFHRLTNSHVHHAHQFQPIRLVAKTFNTKDIAELETLPLSISIKHPSGQNILVCHASPTSNQLGYIKDISSSLEKELDACPEQIIICGHWHHPKTFDWKNKKLIVAGSVGIPMQGEAKAEYLRLSFADQAWQIQHMQIPYNREKTVKEYIESGNLKNGGPVAWLLADELMCSQRRLGHFFPWLQSRKLHPVELNEWENTIIDFLGQHKRWEHIKKLI
jgi:putative phosphoesterase